MKTAIITGASSGLGREFVRQLADVFPDIDCYWLIARRKDRLEEMAEGLPDKTVECLGLDLCDTMSFVALQEKLTAEQPEVAMLINNAGCGYLGNLGEVETSTQTRVIDLNLRALTAITNMVIPFMPAGSHIINVSSIASFCPNPRMTVYSSTKAYVSSFTVGLSEELRDKGIAVTAVCPGPMKTEFFDAAGDHDLFGNIPWCDPVKVVAGTIRAAKKGRTFYTPTAFNKFYRFVAKILPMKWMIKATRV